MPTLTEADIIEICAAFHITREQLPALAAYCASTERAALEEVTLERAATSSESPASADSDSTHAGAGTEGVKYATRPVETWIVGKSAVVALNFSPLSSR